MSCRSQLTGAAFVLLLALAGSNANSQDPVWIWGGGTGSCGKWLEIRKEITGDLQMRQWLLGFVSAHNWYNWYSKGPQVHLLDVEAVYAFVDSYCRNHPLHAVIDAATALIEDLGGTKKALQGKR